MTNVTVSSALVLQEARVSFREGGEVEKKRREEGKQSQKKTGVPRSGHPVKTIVETSSI